MDRAEIEKRVRAKLEEVIGQSAAGESPAKPGSPPTSGESSFRFINQDIVRQQVGRGKIIYLAPGAIVTPLARDLAEREGIVLQTLVEKSESSGNGPRAVAVGADHGGFELKEGLKKYLVSLGYEVVDLGTHSTEAVDYPDFAHRVAQAVASGKCWRGIMIDGAGIGSCMVANKVPGILAAHCRDLFEIKNSREHNNANVLTLGGKVLGLGLAQEMVRQWLETPFEGGRHLKRVDKITTVEEQYTRKG